MPTNMSEIFVLALALTSLFHLHTVLQTYTGAPCGPVVWTCLSLAVILLGSGVYSRQSVHHGPGTHWSDKAGHVFLCRRDFVCFLLTNLFQLRHVLPPPPLHKHAESQENRGQTGSRA